MNPRVKNVQSLQDLQAVAALADSVFFPGRTFFARRYPHIFSLENRANLLFIEENGEPVSFMAGYPSLLILRKNQHVKTYSIGAVCTRTEFRGRGFSSLLLHEMDRIARELGTDLVLISGTGKLYTDYGAKTWGSLTEIHLEKKDFLPPSASEPYRSYSTWSEGLVGEVFALYSQEIPRFERTKKELSLMLEGHFSPQEGESPRVVVLEPPLEGYGVLRTLWEGSTRITFLVEYGGDLKEIWKATQAEARKEQSHKVFVRIPSDTPDSVVRSLASTTQWTTPITGTMKFLSPLESLPSFRVDTLNFV